MRLRSRYGPHIPNHVVPPMFKEISTLRPVGRDDCAFEPFRVVGSDTWWVVAVERPQKSEFVAAAQRAVRVEQVCGWLAKESRNVVLA